MSDYKPGTVAMVTNDDEQLLAFRVSWPAEDWMSVDDGSLHAVSDVRPLVVLDPDDDEQMDAFCKRLVEVANAEREIALATSGIHPDTVAAALRSLIKPPKPPEPQGLGAVVEDTEGVLWVRSSLDGEDSLGKPWKNGPVCKHWQIVDAVRVLSEGVQP